MPEFEIHAHFRIIVSIDFLLLTNSKYKHARANHTTPLIGKYVENFKKKNFAQLFRAKQLIETGKSKIENFKAVIHILRLSFKIYATIAKQNDAMVWLREVSCVR